MATALLKEHQPHAEKMLAPYDGLLLDLQIDFTFFEKTNSDSLSGINNLQPKVSKTFNKKIWDSQT
jgi:hypothetical protein